MTHHKIGDLVYHRGTLGYIEEIERLYPNDHRHHIRWFNPRVEDDVSVEWSIDVSRMKEQYAAYLGGWYGE